MGGVRSATGPRFLCGLRRVAGRGNLLVMRSRPGLAAALAALLSMGGAATSARAQGTVPSGFLDTLVVGGLEFPTGFTFLPDGRILVVEQMTSRIRLIVNGAIAAIDPVATIPGLRQTGGEQGLLGIAVDPGWPGRPYLYIHGDDATGPVIRISRYTVTGDLALTGNGALSVDPATRFDLVNDAPDNAGNHNGGTLRFGLDGKLYASLGDDAASCAAQDTVSLRGVILRLDASQLPAGSGSATRAQVTPSDNPFVARPNLNERLVWEFGLRNPFRFQVDPLDGTLWVGDVGEQRFEEVDHATQGGMNFGWPLYEATTIYTTSCPGAVRGTDPVYWYDRTGFTAAVIAPGIYRRPSGTPLAFPTDYDANLFVSDYYAGFLRRLVLSGGAWVLAPPVPGQSQAGAWGTGFSNVSDWRIGPDGGFWYCRQADDNFDPASGAIRRIVFNGTTSVPPPGSFLQFLPPYPSPANGSCTIAWVLTSPARVEVTIHDLGGRRVRKLVPGEDEGVGPHVVPWDGRDDDHRAVRPGLYLVRLAAGGRMATRRVTLLR